MFWLNNDTIVTRIRIQLKTQPECNHI